MDVKKTAEYKGSNRSQLPDDVSFTSVQLGPGYTTTEKNALTGMVEGTIIFDTTLNKLCVYTGAAWETVTSA